MQEDSDNDSDQVCFGFSKIEQDEPISEATRGEKKRSRTKYAEDDLKGAIVLVAIVADATRPTLPLLLSRKSKLVSNAGL